MKRIFYMLLALLVFPMVALAANETTEWLDKLDKSLANRDTYEKIRVERIDALRNELYQMEKKSETKASDKYFEVMYGLYNEYKSYCYDSAHHYAQKCLTVAQSNNNDDQVVKASNAVAFSLISAGFLTEAYEVLKSIDRKKLSGLQLEEYYEHFSQLWRAQADYVREEPFYTKYITQSNAYLDSLMQIVPKKSVQWWSYKGSRQMRDHEFQQALESFGNVLELCDSDMHQKAMTTSDRVKFIGRIPNDYLRCYYYASDIFAFTSCTKQEAFGIALAEAMYCGSVPVTFTIDGSGVNWVSVNGETCIEVPLGDVKAYAAAIDKLFSDNDLYMKYATAGKERIIKMFTSEKSNKEANAIFKELIDL